MAHEIEVPGEDAAEDTGGRMTCRSVEQGVR